MAQIKCILCGSISNTNICEACDEEFANLDHTVFMNLLRTMAADKQKQIKKPKPEDEEIIDE